MAHSAARKPMRHPWCMTHALVPAVREEEVNDRHFIAKTQLHYWLATAKAGMHEVLSFNKSR